MQQKTLFVAPLFFPKTSRLVFVGLDVGKFISKLFFPPSLLFLRCLVGILLLLCLRVRARQANKQASLAINAVKTSGMSYLTLHRGFHCTGQASPPTQSGSVSSQKMECLTRRRLSPLPAIPA